MTAPQDEWGPWQYHDGKGCPCVGKYAEVEHEWHNGSTDTLMIPCVKGECGWNGRDDEWNVIRYRIKKPRALLDLIQLIADLPAPIKTDGVIA